MRNILVLTILLFLLSGCSKKKSPEPKLTPEKVVLLNPLQNSVCTTGTSTTSTQSTITLGWASAKNATSYEVILKNLRTGAETKGNSTTNEISLLLLKGVPYSWYVIARSKDDLSSNSDTWKFYNAGAGIINYSPYPADELSPKTGQVVQTANGVITLSWKGADTDNDIKNYDLYLGSSNIPGLLKAEISDSKLENVAVLKNAKYYWKVVTRDAQGNTSESDLVVFTTSP